MNIKERRKQLGMSQGELAEKCGITQSAMCDIEKGRNNPKFTTLMKIADVLGFKDINDFKKGE